MKHGNKRVIATSAQKNSMAGIVTPGGPNGKEYPYPDLARHLCAAWLAYTFGESLTAGLRMTPTDPAELGSLWHKLSKAVFSVGR